MTKQLEIPNRIKTKPLHGCEDRYEITQHGRVWSLPNVARKHGAWIVPFTQISSGYTAYNLTPETATRKTYLEHRLVWEFHNGPIPSGMEIDHINRDRSDNRLENLRVVSRCGNMKNKSFYSNNRSGYRGVVQRENGKFRSSIRHKKVLHRLGQYETSEEAALAYDEKARGLGRAESTLNFPKP